MRAFVIFFFYLCCLTAQQQDTTFVNLKDSLSDKGLKAYLKKDSVVLNSTIKKLFNLYKAKNDSAILAKYYHYKSLNCKLQYTNDSAFYYYHQSKNISKKIGDSLEVGRRLLSISNLQREVKDYLGSEISSIEALQYLEPIKSYRYLQHIYNNLGLISSQLGSKDDALKYYDLALKINELNTDSKKKEEGFLFTTNNKGLLHQRVQEHRKAISYFLKGLAFDSVEIKYPLQYALLLENLTLSQYELNQKETVVNRYEEVLGIRKKEKDFGSLPITYTLLTRYYIDKKDNEKAIFHANQALKYAKQTHNNKRWLEALQLLSELTTGEESKQYLKEYITLNDSLFNQERRLKNQFAKIRYETDKKEKENSFLKTENEKKQAEIAYQKQQITIGWLMAGASILFLLSSISFFTLRRKKLLFQAQLQKIEAREQERRQIAKSLHDEVAGDLRMLHRRLEKSQLVDEALKLEMVKDNVRNLSHQLSSVSFDQVTFKDQIINLVSDYFSPEFIIKVNGLKAIDWEQTNNSIKRLLYLGIRESIQNCQKYAQASKMTIDFSINKKTVILDIADNGVGFDTKTSKKGIGLQNLQERVEDVNGTLLIESEVGKGTKTNIQIPLNA